MLVLTVSIKCFASIDNTNNQSDTNDHIDSIHGEISDPLEPFNRMLYEVHTVLDGLFLQPLAEIYDVTVHSYVQDRVHNVLQNLGTPTIVINDCLQGEGEKASNSFARFVINTTLGLGGMYDIAAETLEIQHHHSDFGQTLASYSVDSGPYLFIPLIGPSNFRDFTGTIIDFITDPVNYFIKRYSNKNIVYMRTGIDAVDQRAHLLPITNNIQRSYNPYDSYKILYEQNRNYMLHDGEMNVNNFETPMPDKDD